MNRISVYSISLLLVFVSTSSGQDVRYNYARGTNFRKFKTFKWVPLESAAEVKELTDQQIKSALDAELAKKGLTEVDSDNADLLVGYQVAIGTERQLTSYSSVWGYGSGWSKGGWYGSPDGELTPGQTKTIHTGQLAVDMYDSAKHCLVWRAIVNKTVDPKAKPEKRQKNLQKAAAKLMNAYPPVYQSDSATGESH